MHTRKLLRRLYTERYDEFFEVVRESVEMWGEFEEGPFNTDPLIEPRLHYLSENPLYSVVDSCVRQGKRHLCVFFSCDGTIRCDEYKDRGPDEPLSTTGFTGGVTFDIPVSLVVDLDSGDVEEFEISPDLAWEKWNNWPH